MIFKHFRTKEHGSITVCARFLKDDSKNNAFVIGVAFCSPNEKNFSRKIGRYIAEGRMNSFLDKRSSTFGRSWEPIFDMKYTEPMRLIKNLLLEVKGPQWYPAFLEKWKKHGKDQLKLDL